MGVHISIRDWHLSITIHRTDIRDVGMTLAIMPDQREIDTAMRGSIINGQYVLPFTSKENAVDCLRSLISFVDDD